MAAISTSLPSYFTGDSASDSSSTDRATDMYGGLATDMYGGLATDMYGRPKESKPIGEIGGGGLYTGEGLSLADRYVPPIETPEVRVDPYDMSYHVPLTDREGKYYYHAPSEYERSLMPASTGLLETSFSPKESEPIPYTGGETRPEYGFELGMYDPYREQFLKPYDHYLGGGIDFGTSSIPSFLSGTYSPTDHDFSSRGGNYSRGYKMLSLNKSLSPIEEMQILKQKSLNSQLNNPELQRFALLQNNIKGLLNYGGR